MNIKLAHGGGGRETSDLIHSLILKHLGNEVLNQLEDGAVIETSAKSVFTTDSFVVKPLFFFGGDIGKLAVCGTLNDLSVMGAVPQYLSMALIIEEGLKSEDLDKIIESAAKETRALGVKVVCGDTKVVEKGGADGLFINTSGIGFARDGFAPSIHNIRDGDVLIFSGNAGDHGIAILGARKELKFTSGVKSDCAVLHPLIELIISSGAEIHAMRDATRGGISAVANEMGTASGTTLVLKEKHIPIQPSVRSACELLGMNPLDLANEGKILVSVRPQDADIVLDAMKRHPLGRDAAIIGIVEKKGRFPAIIETPLGSRIILEMPRGELLPRIC